MVKSQAKRLENLKILAQQFKAMSDGDNTEFFTIIKSGECCIDTCLYINTYLKSKQETLDFLNQQIENIEKTSKDNKNIHQDINYYKFESAISRANSAANKLKKQLIFKIQEANIIKQKINSTACNCE